MVSVECDNEECERYGREMDYIDSDDRQEWKEDHYECRFCTCKKTHRTTYDQNGLVIKDEVYTD